MISSPIPSASINPNGTLRICWTGLDEFNPEFRERPIEAPHTGALVAVDTFMVGTLKGVGKVYLQTAIDCHSRYAWARLYTSKLLVTAVHLMNNDVLPTFEAHSAKPTVVLSDNGREFCGRPDRHPYELLLQLEEIEHRTTRVKRPQSNGPRWSPDRSHFMKRIEMSTDFRLSSISIARCSTNISASKAAA